MGLETLTGVDKFLHHLNPNWPTGSDDRSEGDNHLRGIKNVLQNSFPNVNAAVNPSVAEFNYLVGVTSGIQAQLDGKSADSHSHSEYAPTVHSHTEYAPLSHGHTDLEQRIAVLEAGSGGGGTVTTSLVVGNENAAGEVVVSESNLGVSTFTWQILNAAPYSEVKFLNGYDGLFAYPGYTNGEGNYLYAVNGSILTGIPQGLYTFQFYVGGSLLGSSRLRVIA